MNIRQKLEKIKKGHYKILTDIGLVAREQELKAYLVGGMVRDLLLGADNLDIDIVVENNALKLATALTSRFVNCELSAKHDRFHTAKIIFKNNDEKIPVDLASTREETYEFPAALPKVNVSELKKDLIRRDFTINALAISLLPDNFGEIVDLFNGLEDLKNKTIRILHDKSFIDDPTRMIRAVRFACKFGFEVEPHTKKLLSEAISSGKFDNLIEKIRGDRVKIEIRYLFNLQNTENAIKEFFKSGIYRMISTEIIYRDAYPCISTDISYDQLHQWLIQLALIIRDLKMHETIMKNLQMTSEEIKIIKDGFNAFKKLTEEKEINSLIVYRELKNLSIESILIVQGLNNLTINNLISEYLAKTSKIKLEIKGQDLISLGMEEGKKIGETLEKILEKKINNPKMTKEDELNEAKKLINPRF